MTDRMDKEAAASLAFGALEELSRVLDAQDEQNAVSSKDIARLMRCISETAALAWPTRTGRPSNDYH